MVKLPLQQNNLQNNILALTSDETQF